MLPKKGASENLGLSFGGVTDPHGAHPSSAAWYGGPARWAVRPHQLPSPLCPGRGPTGPQAGSALGLGPQTCLLPELLARWCLQATDMPESRLGVGGGGRAGSSDFREVGEG